MEAMWTRFLPHIAEIDRLLAAGALGDIVTVMADHGQWFPKDPASRLFAPELGGGVLLDCGVYPVSFASMVLGKPDRGRGPGHPGIHGCRRADLDALRVRQRRSSGPDLHVFCQDSDPCGDRRHRGPHRDRQPLLRTFLLHADRVAMGAATRFEPPHEGNGLHYEADEVARCLRAGLLESPLMPLDETIAIMETMDAVLAQA